MRVQTAEDRVYDEAIKRWQMSLDNDIEGRLCLT
jgi:hypothetical protein